jgi:hypothetical protein
LTCRKALFNLPNGKNLLKYWDVDEEDKDDLFLTLVRTMSYQLVDLEEHMISDFIVVQKKNQSQYVMMYDNRFLIEQRKKKSKQFRGYILDKKGVLIETVHKLSNMPKLNMKDLNPEEPLWRMVGLENEELNPSNYFETMSFFQKHNIDKKFRVDSFPSLQCWLENNRYCPNIEAFTKNDYTLGFRWMKPIATFQPKRPMLEAKEVIETNEFQANNSAAVKVRLSGLNEAYNLGCISRETFLNLSQQLAETIAVLWIEVDDCNEARFATYKDETRECHFELNKDENTWITMFDYIYKCQSLISAKKSSILSGLIKRLEIVPKNVTNPWKNCLLSLRKCIREMKVAVYSVEDTVLHAIKSYFCFYANLKCPKNFRGVSLNSNAKNDLTMIKIPGLMFFNFGSYLTMDTTVTDAKFSVPSIKNSTGTLRHQQSQNNLSIMTLCKERGKLLSAQLRHDYIENGKHFLNLFNYDIFSLSYVSLSSLAFHVIWHKYTQEAGPYHHGLEKTKLFQEEYLRKYCTGGYSYSCQTQLNCNEPLHPSLNLDKNKYLAKSIHEYDLISSYGYAASNMNCPVGFCTGYTLPEEHEDDNELIKVDRKSRHHSFEFLSVYYTLWTLIQENNVQVRTVYSNFHQYGFLQLGKLTLDLVVITEEGKIKMYAFDGAWAHGCRGDCPNLFSYAGNQSRTDLEEKSQQRDDVINAWCQEMNQMMNCIDFATYTVIAGCHEPQYKVSTMLAFFKTRSELSRLIIPYYTENTLCQSLALEMTPKDMTFIAVVDGYDDSFNSNLPLLLQKKRNNWDRYSSTEEMYNGMLLTKDYYQYLMKNHHFKITKIYKIYFYRNCTVLPNIFKKLVTERMSPEISSNKKQLLKNIVNYAAGFFGYNENKHQTKSVCRLVTQTPTRYGHEHYYKSRLSHLTMIKNTQIMFLQTTTTNQKPRKSCQSALPLYICITEWGKKRLAEVFCFFEKYFEPNSFRFLYSNVDNVIFALSTETLEQAFKKQLWFEAYKKQLFSTTQPGFLKEEFVFTSQDEWKFVSGFTQNYAILTNQKANSIHKASALNRVSTQQAFDASVALLNNEKYTIEQCRRIHKLANLDTTTQTFTF